MAQMVPGTPAGLPAGARSRNMSDWVEHGLTDLLLTLVQRAAATGGVAAAAIGVVAIIYVGGLWGGLS